jgi:hypothetical protein
MIWESGPWKRELERLAASLTRRKQQKRWYESSDAKLEREVFYAAYAVRKLLDACKISDEVEALRIEATAYMPTGRVIDIMNWDRIQKLYDLSKGTSRTISLRGFCDQIIHSFIFMPCFVDEYSANLAGVYIASDHQMEKSLLYFDIDEIIKTLQAVVVDGIAVAEWKRDGPNKPLRVVKKSTGEGDHLNVNEFLEIMHSADGKTPG